MPSRSSLLSGRYPWSIGAWNNRSPTPVHLRSLPQHLSELGYRTVAIGKMHLVGREQFWGLQERPYGDFGGLSHQPDPINTAPRLTYVPEAGPAEIPEEKMQEAIVTRLGLEFLGSHDDSRPFFLWLSYNRPHHPLRPPARLFDLYYPDAADLPELPDGHLERMHPWMLYHRRFFRCHELTDKQVRRARAAYYGCVTLIDEQIGRVLEGVRKQGWLDRTVVIYVSDHGDMIGEHGLWRKSCFYDGAVRVPLIVSWPREFRAGVREAATVELVDLYPTLVELAGGAPEESAGESLPALLSGSGERTKDYAISEYSAHGVPGPMRMVKRGDWKLIWHSAAAPSLFNLREDPDEFEDRGEERRLQPVLHGLSRLALHGWDREHVRSNWEPASSLRDVPVEYSPRTPNQFHLPDGTLMDAEDFYPPVRWDEFSVEPESRA